MFIGDLLAAVLIAAVVVAIFALFGRPGPWGGAVWFFLVIFLGAWAIGTWAQPLGPMAWGVAWVPLLIGALLLGLLLAAVPGPRVPARSAHRDAEAAAAGAVGAVFWMLLLGLLIVIGLGYAFA